MTIDLHIVSPDGEWFRGPVEGVVLPGSEGDFGVLPAHERFLAPLRIGHLEIRTPDDTSYAAISEGFADVSGEEVVVMVESCVFAHEVDLAEAELARERAEQGLAQLTDADDERYRAYEKALAVAANRIALREKVGGDRS